MIDILFNLCPECRHNRACAGPIGPKVQPAAKGGHTCIEYSPRPNPKARVSDEHILQLPDREPCGDCASRKGSTPNGTHHSMADFELCVRERQPFLCHADGHGRICAGWLRVVKARAEIEDAEVLT
jgi:hypothetical protein